MCLQKPEALDGAGEAILYGSQLGSDTLPLAVCVCVEKAPMVRPREEAGVIQASDGSGAGWVGFASESAGGFQDNLDCGTWITNKCCLYPRAALEWGLERSPMSEYKEPIR